MEPGGRRSSAAVRDLFGNPTAIPADPAWPLAHPIPTAVLWIVGLLAVAVPLTIRRFKQRTIE